jgi:hypothetical protein
VLHSVANELGSDDWRFRGRRRYRNVRPRESVLELVEAARGRTEALGNLIRAASRAVRHGDLDDPATRESLERLKPDAPCSDDQDALLTQVSDNAFGES